MSLELNPNQEPLAHIKKTVESHNCPNEIQTIKEYINILKGESEFYLASKLLNLARDKQSKLR